MFVFILTFIIGSIIAAIFAWYLKHYNYDKNLAHLKRPTGLPLFGSALEFKNTGAAIPVLTKYMNKFGKTFRIILGFEHYLIITDHDHMEFLLSSTKLITKSVTYKFLSNWLGNGLLTSTGSYWKRNRKIITPTFHFKILEEFLHVFHTNSNILVEKLRAELGKSSVNIYPYVTNCALDIICETAMGTSVNAQEDSDTEYVHAVHDMCRIVIERSFSAIQQIDPLYKFTANYRLEKKNLKILHGYTNKVIAERRDMLVKSMSNAADDGAKNLIDGYSQVLDDTGVKKRFAFLDVLLQARTPEGEPLTNEEIRQEVDTFMFEGHDTTSSAVSFCMYLLANNAEAQEKVTDELRSIFGRDSDTSSNARHSQTRSPTYQDLQDMKYLDLVIKETLRMYPSVPAFARVFTNDVEFDGHIYPAGLQALVFVVGVQNNPKYFPNPEKFDPERFSAESQLNKLPFLYVPFSAGQRNCIGQKFAVQEVKAAISKVLRSFELLPATPASPPQLIFESILKSKNGINIQLKERKW